MKKLILLTAIAVVILCPQPASAWSEDVLENLHTSHNRPWVPSDAAPKRLGEDMIKIVPNLFTSDKDMFDSIKIVPISMNEDMLRTHRQRSYAYGSPIFTNDDWTQ